MAASLELAKYLHYSCPIAAVFFVSVSALVRRGNTHQEKSLKQSRRYAVLVGLVVACYIAEVAAVCSRADELPRFQGHTLHLATLALVWSALGLQRDHASHALWGTALITALFEAPLLGIAASRPLNSPRSIIQLISQSLRMLALLWILVDRAQSRTQQSTQQSKATAEEAQPFLQHQAENASREPISYGTRSATGHLDAESHSGHNDGSDFDGGDDSDSDDDADIKRRRAKRLKQTGGWRGYLKDFSIFTPYLIPRRDRKVQASIVASLLCLAGNRVLKVLVPQQIGLVIDKLLDHEAPYQALAIWLLLNLLNDDAGLGLVLALVKIPIKQFSYRQIVNAAFSHVMNLSMEFHSDRDSAEVMKAIEQGESLTNVLETAIIEILPTFIDLSIAFGLLYLKFNALVALAMVAASVAFISLEVFTSSWNIENRRVSAKAQREEARVMHQAVQGWQTVVYFNMFGYERRRFGSAVESQLAANKDWGKRDAYIRAMLEAMVPITFFTLASLILYEISKGRASAGDFVFFIQYWEYLIYPLKWLSHDYRYLMSDLVDAERLLNLLQTKPTVVDKEGAKPLGKIEGHVTFENVFFSYDPRKPSIQGMNISAAPGETIALVGATGAGKSTIVKLLLRFYNVTSGRIAIDGQNIQDVTLSSLRDSLGIVPQNPLLFNASIMENLRYARPSATDDEIFEACRAAAIHSKILTFADGYSTRVGEQGVRLSGGEIQRLAIARVFLKNPPILILDEATSAVDTGTEADIQDALDGLRAERTTFLIAHRLSTVVDADQILVVDEGRVVESGTHSALLRQETSRYRDLWLKQVGRGLKDDEA